MKTDVLLLTKNDRLVHTLKQLVNARVHAIDSPLRSGSLFKGKGKYLEVALLDLNYPQRDINSFIFYVKHYRKNIPVLLLGTDTHNSIETEAMRNLSVYGYIKHPINLEELAQVLEDLNRLFQLDTDKKFETVHFLENENVFACTFKDLKKYFLKRDAIVDAGKGDVLKVSIDKSGYHFTVYFSSGQKSVVPWDLVKHECVKEYVVTGNHESSLFPQECGQRIKTCRKLVGLTQEKLASKTGIQRANIARIESGKHRPSLQTLEKIAKALDRPVVNFIVA